MVYTQHLICLLAVLSNPAGASFLRGARESNESVSLEKAVGYDEVDFATDDLMMMEAMEATDDLMMFEAEEERDLQYFGAGRRIHGGYNYGYVGNYGVNSGPSRVGGNYGYGSLYGGNYVGNYVGNYGGLYGVNGPSGAYIDSNGNFVGPGQGGDESFNTGFNYNFGPYSGFNSQASTTGYQRGYYNGDLLFNRSPYNTNPNTYDTYSYRYNYGNANPYSYNSGSYNSFNNNYYPSYGYGYAPNFYRNYNNGEGFFV